jgi:lipopolysaccharide export LptBFGC system permease protein LptF
VILDRYVTRIFVSTFGVVLLFILSIFLVLTVIMRIDALLEVREALVARGHSVPGILGRYCLISIPFLLLQFLPFVTIISASIAFVRLLRGNEIVPMIVAGRSPGRIATPVMCCAGLVALSMFAMQEWAAPRLSDSRLWLESLMDGRFEGEFDDVPRLEDGAGNIWTIDRFNPRNRRIEGVRVLRFRDPETGLERGTLEIPSAVWRTGVSGRRGWHADGAVLVLDAEGTGLGRREAWPADRPLPTDLRPDRIELMLAKESPTTGAALSLSEAARKARDAPDDPRPLVLFHGLLTWPLANLLLLLLGLPFLFRLGERNFLVGIGIALLLSAAYFATDHVICDFGKRGALPPMLAAWMPVVLFASLAFAIRDALRF